MGSRYDFLSLTTGEVRAGATTTGTGSGVGSGLGLVLELGWDGVRIMMR